MNNDVFFRDDADKLMAYLKGYMKGGRYIPILDTIDDKLVSQVAAALIQMEVEEVKPITLFIHTDGGTGKGFMLENVINSLRSPVDGLVFGSACSMGAILLQMCRTRKMMPQAEIYCHHPKLTYKLNGRFDEINMSDIAILHKEALRAHERQKTLFMKRTGKTSEEIDQLFRIGEIYNSSICALEAKELNLIDEIVTDFKFFDEGFKGKKASDKKHEEAEKKD